MPIKQRRVESHFLEEVLESLKRRSKALKHRNATPVVDRFLEVDDGRTEERIELRFQPRQRQTLVITLWSDRHLHVLATESISQAGRKFEYQSSGRFIGGNDGRHIVGAIESTLSEMFEMTAEQTPKFSKIWDPILAAGLKGL